MIATYAVDAIGRVSVDASAPMLLDHRLSNYRTDASLTAESLPYVIACLSGANAWHATVAGLSLAVEGLADDRDGYTHRVVVYQFGRQVGARRARRIDDNAPFPTPLSRLILASGLGLREIARQAGLDASVVAQARDGADTRLSTARKILAALGKGFADLDRE